MKQEKYKLAYIKWCDAQSEADWATIQGMKDWAKEDLFVHDVGWLIVENKKYLILCSQITTDGDFGNKTKIPTKWIVERKELIYK